MQPAADLAACLLRFFTLHHKQNPVTLFAAFGGIAFSDAAVAAQTAQFVKAAADAVARIGVEGDNGFATEIVGGEQAFYGWRVFSGGR